jgi:hypothetical protein
VQGCGDGLPVSTVPPNGVEFTDAAARKSETSGWLTSRMRRSVRSRATVGGGERPAAETGTEKSCESSKASLLHFCHIVILKYTFK